MNSKSKTKCVYYFFNESDTDTLSNKTRKNKKPIHKIVKNNVYISNELTNIKKIREILDYTHFFYVYDASSELKVTEFDQDILKSDDTLLLKFDGRELIYLKNYLKALSSPKQYIFTVIDFYRRLLKSIDLLVTQRVIHNRICFDTVMVDERGFPLISDFSVSTNSSHNSLEQYIKLFFIEYDPSYLEWPLEFHILSYLLTNKLNSLSSYNIETIITDVVKNHSILNTFGSQLVSLYKEEALKYFTKYVNQSYSYILTDIFQYSSTWDNYALSIMFLRILIGIHRSINKIVKNKFIILFMKLLVENIHGNPLKRLSILETTNKFESIIDSLEPKDYKEVIDCLSS